MRHPHEEVMRQNTPASILLIYLCEFSSSVIVIGPSWPSFSPFLSLFKLQASLPRLSLTPKLINHKLIATLKSQFWKWLLWPSTETSLRRIEGSVNERSRGCEPAVSTQEQPGTVPLLTASVKTQWSNLCCNNRENITQRKLQGGAISS